MRRRRYALLGVRRSFAVLIAMLCCELSFNHHLATWGPKKQWGSFDHYLAQTFAQDWKCEVASSVCWLDERAPRMRAATVGLQAFALCSPAACFLLALALRRRLKTAMVIVGIGSIGLAQVVVERGTVTSAAWVAAICPIAIALVLEVRRRPSLLAKATLR